MKIPNFDLPAEKIADFCSVGGLPNLRYLVPSCEMISARIVMLAETPSPNLIAVYRLCHLNR